MKVLNGEQRSIDPGNREAAAAHNRLSGLEVAVTGMAGRFPGADNIDEFWENIKNGKECIEFLSDRQLEEAGVGPGVYNRAGYVKARGGAVNNYEYFDASFFGYTAVEARMMDPQIRLFHECAWEALEDAGYDPGTYKGLIGVFAGVEDNTDWRFKVFLTARESGDETWSYLGGLISNKDFVSMRISYKLNLKGPAYALSTTCSTGLAAIHAACRSLLGGECDMALAGAGNIKPPADAGYMYREGMLYSADGHVRAFDAGASGTIFGSGIGIVVLKPLEDALADGDHIYAVIRGSAVNNDGSRKVNFTAPSVKGQEEVIKAAFQLAETDPATIGYVETHGTGTPLGDPIEIRALTRAFNLDKKGMIPIGSLKTNIGHLDCAAGIAGFIKTVLVLAHRLIPPSLNYETPNPAIDFDNSPFYVNTGLKEWRRRGFPLRAGVSSFGFGGTNAHAVLEEAPVTGDSRPQAESPQHRLILLSAKTREALEKRTRITAAYLQKNPRVNLADAAYTLQVGRVAFPHRRAAVCSTVDETVRELTSPGPGNVHTFCSREENPPVIFMFSGQGSQYVNMGIELYQKETVFREEMDRCFDILNTLLDYDIKEILYPGGTAGAAGHRDIPNVPGAIDRTEIAQPLLFAFEYTMARVLIRRGIRPRAMIGHSIGEYAAACLAGVFSLPDALKLVVLRGKSMQKMPAGSMLSVPLPAIELKPLLHNHGELSLAAKNSSSLSAVSGPTAAVENLKKELEENGHRCKLLHTSHAFHSKMMDPILDEFETGVGKVTLNRPEIPYLSNVTGNWITVEEASSPRYWSVHLRETVCFSDGIEELLKTGNSVFVEVGPGKTLSTFVRQHKNKTSSHRVINLVKHPKEEVADMYLLLDSIGQLWCWGINPGWRKFYGKEKRYRLSLPTYPFESERYRLEGDPFAMSASLAGKGPRFVKKPDIADWFYIPTWKRVDIPAAQSGEMPGDSCWLLFVDECGLGIRLARQLRREGQRVITVKPGDDFLQENDEQFTINPHQPGDSGYDGLFSRLVRLGRVPRHIVHLWCVTGDNHLPPGIDMESTAKFQDLGFYSLLNIVKAIDKNNINDEIRLAAVTDKLQKVTGEETGLLPGKAVILGAIKVIPAEYNNIGCRIIDVVLPSPGDEGEQVLIRQLMQEFISGSPDMEAAYRGNHRWVRHFEPVRLEKSGKTIKRLRYEGVYLVTGGLGGVGQVLCRYLAKSVPCKLILTGRSPLPPRHRWAGLLAGADKGEDNGTVKRIRNVQALEALGAEVMVFGADAADRERMQGVITRGEEEFGPIDGVIHCAGLAGGEMIQAGKREAWERILAPKVGGALVLDALFKDRTLDFVILCSSAAVVLPALGQAAYCAANAFLDAFANHRNNPATLWTAIAWDRWQNLGMAVTVETEYRKLTGEDLPGGMRCEEGVEVFSRILADNLPQAAVLSCDLGTMLSRVYGDNASFKENLENVSGAETVLKRPELDTEYAAPENDIQQILTRIWAEFLGFEQVGIHDDFFQLGGDSLKALVIAARIHKELNRKIPLDEFFKTPTVSGLAGYITGMGEQEFPGEEFTTITPVEKKEYYPLSYAQKRMYFLQQIDSSGVTYNMWYVMKMKGVLEEQGLERAFRELIQRHEALRTSIELVDNQPVQRVHEYGDIDFNVEYFTAAAHETGSIVRNFDRVFELDRAPLFRAGLIKIEEPSPGEYILVVDMHHIISDGTSLGILVKDFSTFYNGSRDRLSLLTCQYKDFSQWQNRLVDRGGEDIKKQEQYWLNRFKDGVPVLKLPLDFPYPASRSFEGDTVTCHLDEDICRRLYGIGRELNTSVYMVLLTTYYILLAKYSGQRDIVVGSKITGRTHAGLENVIGMFVNMLALRNSPGEDRSFREFLEEVKESSLRAYENQDYPFSRLVKKLGLSRQDWGNPLFETVFALGNMEIEEVDIRDLEVTYQIPEIIPAQFDLHIESLEIKGTIKMIFSYAAKLFKRSTIEKMAARFKDILNQVTADIDVRLKDITFIHDLIDVPANIFKEDQNDFVF